MRVQGKDHHPHEAAKSFYAQPLKREDLFIEF